MLVIIDLETTGKDPKRAEILELGAVTLDGESTFTSLVNPGFDEPEDLEPYTEALSINHIDPKAVLSAPDMDLVCSSFTDWMKDLEITHWCYGGWNSSRYDAVILERKHWIPRDYWIVDVMDMAHKIMGSRRALPMTRYGSYKWPTLSEGMSFFQVDPRGDLHRALTDAMATRDILVKILMKEA